MTPDSDVSAYATRQGQRITNALPADTGDSTSTTGPHVPAPLSPPRKRKGGAPAGNANGVVHGLYGVGLPKGAERLNRRLNAFRRSLCAAVEARGAIGLWEAATIDTACHWLRHGLLAARWLRIEHDQLSPTDRLTFSREVARASGERDKCIKALGIASNTISAIDALYAPLSDVDPSPALPPERCATGTPETFNATSP